jgi:hypothetical protein
MGANYPAAAFGQLISKEVKSGTYIHTHRNGTSEFFSMG